MVLAAAFPSGDAPDDPGFVAVWHDWSTSEFYVYSELIWTQWDLSEAIAALEAQLGIFMDDPGAPKPPKSPRAIEVEPHLPWSVATLGSLFEVMGFDIGGYFGPPLSALNRCAPPPELPPPPFPPAARVGWAGWDDTERAAAWDVVLRLIGQTTSARDCPPSDPPDGGNPPTNPGDADGDGIPDYYDPCPGDANLCCGSPNPCCGSNDPCCGNPNPCCGNPDPCCGSNNPCCGSSDPCCGSGDPCCGTNDPCCDSDDPCCGSTDPCCGAEPRGQDCEACIVSDDCDDSDSCTADACCDDGTCDHRCTCISIGPGAPPALCPQDQDPPPPARPGIIVKLNNDDDNQNDTVDHDETGPLPAADNELVAVSIASATDGTIRLSGWSNKIRLYTSAAKEELIMLPRCWSACESNCRPMSEWTGLVYVEGREASAFEKDIALTASFKKFSANCQQVEGQCGDQARLAVVHIERLYWDEHELAPENAALDWCENNDGRRILPDKLSPGDPEPLKRRQVDLVAEVKPAVEDVDVFFKVFDVDDPFDQLNAAMPNVAVIDPTNPTNGPDNRPIGEAPVTLLEDKTDDNGIARRAFTVSMQPGNNYRASASLIQGALSQNTLQNGQTLNPQQQADAVSAKFPSSPGSWEGYELPVVWSEMLTVWRKLHVETDTMVRPTFAQNTYGMNWASPLPGGAPDRVQISVEDTFAFATADGQFNEGWVTLTGSAGTATGHIFAYTSSAGWDEMIVTISAANGIGGQKGLAGLAGMPSGTAVVSDDDLQEELTFKNGIWGCNDAFAVGHILAPPDLSALELRYSPAYILPLHDMAVSAVGGLVTFVQHFDESDDDGKALWDQALPARGLPVSTQDYWTVMVITAFQAETSEDADPDAEQQTNGINTHGDGATASYIGPQYTGVCAVFAAATRGESDVPERYTVAHEIGHTLGLPHTNSGLMIARDPNEAPSEQSKPFIAESLELLREYGGP